MANGKLSVKITADASNYNKSLDNSTKKTEQFNKTVSGLSSGLKSGLATSAKVAGAAIGAVATGLSAALVAGVKYNAEIEQYQTSFEVMTGSADKAAQTMDKLVDLGAKTPFETSDLANATQLLMNYGFTADGAVEKMTMLGDIAQGSADKMQRIAMAYGKMSSAGKVQLEYVNQMIEAGFNPLQEISESTGESMASLYQRISDGALSVDEITASMERSTAAGGRYFQSMEKQSKTLSGQFSTLKDSASRALGAFAQSSSDAIAGNIFPTLNDGLSQITEQLKAGNMSALGQIGGQMIAGLVASITQQLPMLLSTTSSLLSNLFQGLKNQLPTIMSSLFSGLGDFFGTQLPAIVSSLVVLLNGVMVSLNTMLPTLIPQLLTGLSSMLSSILTMAPYLLQMGITLIISLVNGLTQEIPTLIPTIVSALLTIVDTLVDPANLAGIISAGLNLILTLAQALVGALPSLVGVLPRIIKGVVSGLISLLPQLIPIGLQIMVTLATSLTSQIDTIISALPEVFAAIIGAFSEVDWGKLGHDIINGLIKGLKSMLSSLRSTLGNIASGISDTFKDLLGIHSPSKVFMQYGVYTDEGYAIGLKKAQPLIEKTLNQLPLLPEYNSTQFEMNTATNVSRYANSDDNLGDYIIAAVVDTSRLYAQEIGKGISNMRMTVNNREAGRFISDLGFTRG